LAGAVALGLAALPAAAQQADGPFNGPYAGVYLGYADYDLDLDLEGFNENPVNIDGAEYGVYGGYGLTFDGNLYAAGELEWGAGPSAENVFDESDVDFNVHSTYGISGIFGYLPAPNTLVYGRLGWQQVMIEDKEVNRNEYLDGLRVGAGVEVAVTENVRLRGEYAFTSYGKQDFSGIDVTTRQNLFRVGVAYAF